MPTYDYRCTSCGHQFEKVQKFTDEAIKVCPVCGQPVRKVFHPAGVVFKGSGWYINDSRKTNNGKSNSENAAKDKEKDKDNSQEKEVEKVKAENSDGDTKADPKTKTDSNTGDSGKAETKTEKTETKKSETSTSSQPAA